MALRYCLDTWPLIEWLRGREPVQSRVDQLLDQRPYLSVITVGELWYVIERDEGAERADGIVAELRPNLELDAVTLQRVLEAAALKARHGLGFADSFVAATALAHDAVLVTGDPDLIEGDPPWQVEDLRPRS